MTSWSRNIGGGPTGSPVTVKEFLPTGFTYDATYTPVAKVNGAAITPTVSTASPNSLNQPLFTIPAAIAANNQLTITFRANVPANASPGVLLQHLFGDPERCAHHHRLRRPVLALGAGTIGDFVWRDWNGDGVQDSGEEGISGRYR